MRNIYKLRDLLFYDILILITLITFNKELDDIYNRELWEICHHIRIFATVLILFFCSYKSQLGKPELQDLSRRDTIWWAIISSMTYIPMIILILIISRRMVEEKAALHGLSFIWLMLSFVIYISFQAYFVIKDKLG